LPSRRTSERVRVDGVRETARGAAARPCQSFLEWGKTVGRIIPQCVKAFTTTRLDISEHDEDPSPAARRRNISARNIPACARFVPARNRARLENAVIQIGFGRGQAMQVVDRKRALLPKGHSKSGGGNTVSVRLLDPSLGLALAALRLGPRCARPNLFPTDLSDPRYQISPQGCVKRPVVRFSIQAVPLFSPVYPAPPRGRRRSLRVRGRTRARRSRQPPARSRDRAGFCPRACARSPPG
jgi:hypothetical protein